ncbi:MAG: HNH endonuclease [Pseudomonadota bacterium]
MAFGVFMHRSDSIYDDVPAVQYQFPKQYLGRARPCEGDWIVYLEPSKVLNSRGYFAVARVQQIIPDPRRADMYLAIIAPNTFLEFGDPVPFSGPEGWVERGLLNDQGNLSGRAQAAVRPLDPADFARIVTAGLGRDTDILPRSDQDAARYEIAEAPDRFDHPAARLRSEVLLNRAVRDRNFRKVVLRAYGERCALTGLRLINGGGRAEVEAAHIWPVSEGGPDIVTNGLALSGTAHWMFDRGLISLSDSLEILISRQVNDPDAVRAMLHPGRQAMVPDHPALRPRREFVDWHRENCFKV